MTAKKPLIRNPSALGLKETQLSSSDLSDGPFATTATFTATTAGLVPASGGGTSNFLRADGTFAAPPGGGGSGDMLSTQINAEVAITTTATATISAWNHVAATSATYTVTLPALASNYGKFLGLLMDPANTYVNTIAGAGSDKINGLATRVMWANESAVLYADQSAGQWVKVAGLTIPMSGSIGVSANQTFANSTWTILSTAFATSLYLNAPAAFMTAASGRINILRPGRYRMTLSVLTSTTNGTLNSPTIGIAVNGTASAAYQFSIIGSSSYNVSLTLDVEASFAAGAYLQPSAYYSGGSYTTTFIYNDTASHANNWFTVTEIPTW